MEQEIKKTIAYNQAIELNDAMGKLNTKPLSNTDYVKTLHFKRKIKGLVAEHKDMRDQIFKDHNIQFNYDLSINVKPNEIQKMNNMDRALKELSNGHVEISGTNFLKMSDFELIRQTNNLTLDEEDLLIEWLVDPHLDALAPAVY